MYIQLSKSLSLAGLTFAAGAALTLSGCVISTNNEPGGTGTGTGTGSSAAAPSGGGGTASGSTDTSQTGGGAAVCDRAAVPATTVSKAVTADAVWSGVVLLDGNITVGSGAKLTISPGTTILASPGASLQVGYLNSKSALIANGTAQNPIHFCGKTATAGSWAGIELTSSTTSLNSLSYVTIEDAGQAQGAALELNATAKVNSLTVKNSAGDGVHAAAFTAGSDKLTVTTCEAPVRLTSQAALTNFPVGGQLTGNKKDMVLMDFSSVTTDVTQRKLDIPYLQLQSISHGEGTWTMEPGVQHKVAADRRLEVGYLSAKSTLAWNGTAAAPIVFSGETESAGSWRGILIKSSTTTNSKLSFVKVKHGGGSSEPSIHALAAVSLMDVSIEDAAMGLEIGNPGLAQGSTKVSVARVTDHPIVAEAKALTSMPVGGTFADNAKNTIKVKGGNIDKAGTIPAMPISYYLSSDLSTGGSIALTIAAGTTFEMGADTAVQFGYLGAADTVTAVGTQAAPIVFKGATNTAGFWKGIRVQRSVTSNSKFDYVQVSDAGQGPTGQLELDATVSVKNSKFSNSPGWGIRHKSSDTSDYKTSNTFEGNASGDVAAK